MRKVLAVASVEVQHKELVFKELKKIFRKIKIPLDILLQEELSKFDQNIDNGNVFKSYPYITLTIPNYEQHRLCTLCLTQIYKKYTKTTSSSVNSCSLFPKAPTTTNWSSTETKTSSSNTLEVGITQSVAHSTALQPSPLWNNRSIKSIRCSDKWIFAERSTK